MLVEAIVLYGSSLLLMTVGFMIGILTVSSASVLFFVLYLMNQKKRQRQRAMKMQQLAMSGQPLRSGRGSGKKDGSEKEIGFRSGEETS